MLECQGTVRGMEIKKTEDGKKGICEKECGAGGKGQNI